MRVCGGGECRNVDDADAHLWRCLAGFLFCSPGLIQLAMLY